MKQILFRADGNDALSLSVNALPATLDLSAEAKAPALQPNQDTPVDNQDAPAADQDTTLVDNQDTKRHPQPPTLLGIPQPQAYLYLRIAGLVLTALLVVVSIIRIAKQK